MQLFNFSLRAKGFDIKRAKQLLNNIQQKNDSEFEAFILERRSKILKYHLENNSFYKLKAKHVNVNDWSSVPIITKSDLQQPMHHILSNGFDKNMVYTGKTSGSSGNPFYFAKDKFTHALTWAQIINRFSWYNIDFNTCKQARFYGIPLDKKGYYIERFKDILANRFRFSVFDLSDDAFEMCLNKFSKTKFNYVNGYTSPIVQFAKFLERKGLVLKDICPTLTVCITTSEMLFENDRKLIEKQIGVPVVNEYGASELDLIAFENPNGNWQVNSETLFVEILDENDMVLPYGQEGRLVITSLFNQAMPFIRYEIGDVGVLSKKSTLRKPILDKLVGRTNDIALLPSGKKVAGLTFYYITKSIIEDGSDVKEFVIEQRQPHLFKINYVAEKELSSHKKNKIEEAMYTYLEAGLSIEFAKLDKLNRSNSGKLKQFTSLVKH